MVSGLAAAAVTATVAWWYGWNIDPFVMDARFWPREPWRLVTCTLPHANIFHLAFNVYWFWVFGTLVEEVYGHLSTLLILVMFAAGSSAAEFALAAWRRGPFRRGLRTVRPALGLEAPRQPLL